MTTSLSLPRESETVWRLFSSLLHLFSEDQMWNFFLTGLPGIPEPRDAGGQLSSDMAMQVFYSVAFCKVVFYFLIDT